MRSVRHPPPALGSSPPSGVRGGADAQCETSTPCTGIIPPSGVRGGADAQRPPATFTMLAQSLVRIFTNKAIIPAALS